MDIILGIDLGTTNSVVSVIRDGKPEVLKADDGSAILPSVVGLDDQGGMLVGQPAKNQLVVAPQRTVKSIKRKMGQDETVTLGDQTFRPQEVSAIILRTLKARAEKVLGQSVSKAVITVPAFFDEAQRQATRQAGELADLEVVRIINEPTAASLTYPHGDEREMLLVYDLGGGTFDVSVVTVEEGVVEVMASHGDTHLGGDDMDQALFDYVTEKFNETSDHKIDWEKNVAARARVMAAVERAKIELSDEAYAHVEAPFLDEKDGAAVNMDIEIARPEYEMLIEPILERTLQCLEQVLTDASIQASRIDKVVLVGGATRTPLVRTVLEERLGQPVHLEVDPDLCVSLGAAIQGGMIAGVEAGPVLVDVTAHSLGIGCLGELYGLPSPDVFSVIIPRNTPLPASRTELYRTAHDNQKVAEIPVFQGEHPDVRKNTNIGEVRVEGLAEMEAGNAIAVRFDLDLSGLLKVTGTEHLTGLAKETTIENAVERYRTDERDKGAAKLSRLFDQEGGDADAQAEAAATVAGDDAHAQARELIAKAGAEADKAGAEDAQELRDLAQQLQQAVDAGDDEQIESLSAKLDDVIFYLQDQ